MSFGPGGGGASRFAECGCCYVAYGFEYFMLAAHSARTLKRHNPDLPTTLVTNLPVASPAIDGVALFDQVILRADASEANRLGKIGINLVSPYEKTLYLDSDTEVWGDLSPIFRLLDGFDISVRLMNKVTKSAFEVFEGVRADEMGLSEWNAGVLFFRDTDRTRELFQRWRDIFEREGMRRDQPALLRAVLQTRDLRILPLGPGWNAKPTKTDEFELIEERPGDIRIFHYREPLTRPEVARRIFRTFREVEPQLEFASSNSEEGVRLAEEIQRFRILYQAYAVALRAFDHRWGRRLLQWHKGRLLRPWLRRYFGLRARLGWGPRIHSGRDTRLKGASFPAAPRPAG